MSGKKQAPLCGIKKCMFIAFNMILTMEIPLDQLISGFLAKMQFKISYPTIPTADYVDSHQHSSQSLLTCC